MSLPTKPISSQPSNNNEKKKKRKGQRWTLQMMIVLICAVSVMFVLVGTQVDTTSHSNPPEHSLKPPPSRIRPSVEKKKGNEDFEFPSPLEKLGTKASQAKVKIVPLFGKHRPDSDVVFGFGSTATLEDWLRFIGTLLDTGYNGDIVIGIKKTSLEQLESTEPELKTFFEHHAKHSHLIVYSAELVCKKFLTKHRCKGYKMYYDRVVGGYWPDPRHYREVAQLRFEYYWAWSTQYSAKARIFLLDVTDTFFQDDPFKNITKTTNNKQFTAHSLMTFQESPLRKIQDEFETKIWKQEEKHDFKVVLRLGKKNILVAGAVVGGQPAIEAYCRAMVFDHDSTECQHFECAQVSHNYLFWGSILKKSKNIKDLSIAAQGKSTVNTLRNLIRYGGKTLREADVINSENHVVNEDGKISPVVHQYEEDEDLKAIADELTAKQQQKWRTILETQKEE